jgi:hypothetical protein
MLIALEDIQDERRRQEQKWGIQHREDGTSGDPTNKARRDLARELCDMKEKLGPKKGFTGGASWTHVLSEEAFESFCETDLIALRKELIQTAAVCVAWIEDIDSRKP